ncbi:NAD-binding protein [Zobellella sp. An-6]|uniref:NAD-binding protein n=1 Tax=Zobellella sp. An-6 TaxID=3400218 RepID=UPI0040436F8E
MFRFGIIGAGWYGCHIASSFKALGFDVKVFDRKESVLALASGNNQFRLHQGFHYARSYRTRVQSRDGYMRFIERYPTLSDPITHNLYAVPNQDSLIDFLTYRLIMTSSGIEFSEVKAEQHGLTNCSGVLLTDERVMRTDKARELFNLRLKDNLQLATTIENVDERDGKVFLNGEAFDYVIDATWGSLLPIDHPVFYEPTLLLYYRSKIGSYALTMVDGNLCSIYPTEAADIFTLSSVTHTPLGKYNTMAAARHYLSQVDASVIDSKRKLMEEQVKRYMPEFCEKFEYIAPQLSVKTKIIGATDDRSCYVSKQGRKFVVMSGKIDTIFYASESILSMIEAENEIQVSRI